MRRFIITLMLSVVVSGATIFAQSAQLQFYKAQYQIGRSFPERLGIMEEVVKLSDEGVTEFLAQSLKDLNLSLQTVRSMDEAASADQTAILLCNNLGEKRYTASAADIWRSVNLFSNSLVKSEGMIALGKMNAAEYFPDISRNLLHLTLDRADVPALSGERIAYGAIMAIRYYNNPEGYIPVFLATSAWYSEWVKFTARETLTVLSSDPSVPLETVILGLSYTYEQKFLALQAIDTANIGGEKKAAFAVTALREAWRNRATDVKTLVQLSAIRKLALDIARRNGSADTALYALCERCYREGYGAEEKLDALAMLGAIKTDDSAKLLTTFLNDMNEMVRHEAITAEENDLLRSILRNLGATGSAFASAALQTVLHLPYPSQIQAIAAEEITRLGGTPR
jgi:hypothetical protein